MTNTAVVAVIRGMARSLMASDERGYSVPAMREDIPCGDQMIECRERERGDDGSTRKCSRREREMAAALAAKYLEWRQNKSYILSNESYPRNLFLGPYSENRFPQDF